MIIGVYKIWVLFSYIGLLFGGLSMHFSLLKEYKLALLFMLLTSLVDIFDGSFARKYKRDSSEKQFGIEIDSILDTVNFGIVPIVFMINFGLDSLVDKILYFIYICAVTMRLAYFNVYTAKTKDINQKYELYNGFPVTIISLVMVLLYIIYSVIPYKIVYEVGIVCTIIMYIFNFKVKRYKNKLFNIALILFGLILIVAMALV